MIRTASICATSALNGSSSRTAAASRTFQNIGSRLIEV